MSGFVISLILAFNIEFLEHQIQLFAEEITFICPPEVRQSKSFSWSAVCETSNKAGFQKTKVGLLAVQNCETQGLNFLHSGDI